MGIIHIRSSIANWFHATFWLMSFTKNWNSGEAVMSGTGEPAQFLNAPQPNVVASCQIRSWTWKCQGSSELRYSDPMGYSRRFSGCCRELCGAGRMITKTRVYTPHFLYYPNLNSTSETEFGTDECLCCVASPDPWSITDNFGFWSSLVLLAFTVMQAMLLWHCDTFEPPVPITITRQLPVQS